MEKKIIITADFNKFARLSERKTIKHSKLQSTLSA